MGFPCKRQVPSYHETFQIVQWLHQLHVGCILFFSLKLLSLYFDMLSLRVYINLPGIQLQIEINVHIKRWRVYVNLVC